MQPRAQKDSIQEAKNTIHQTLHKLSESHRNVVMAEELNESTKIAAEEVAARKSMLMKPLSKYLADRAEKRKLQNTPDNLTKLFTKTSIFGNQAHEDKSKEMYLYMQDKINAIKNVSSMQALSGELEKYYAQHERDLKNSLKIKNMMERIFHYRFDGRLDLKKYEDLNALANEKADEKISNLRDQMCQRVKLHFDQLYEKKCSKLLPYIKQYSKAERLIEKHSSFFTYHENRIKKASQALTAAENTSVPPYKEYLEDEARNEATPNASYGVVTNRARRLYNAALQWKEDGIQGAEMRLSQMKLEYRDYKKESETQYKFLGEDIVQANALRDKLAAELSTSEKEIATRLAKVEMDDKMEEVLLRLQIILPETEFKQTVQQVCQRVQAEFPPPVVTVSPVSTPTSVISSAAVALTSLSPKKETPPVSPKKTEVKSKESALKVCFDGLLEGDRKSRGLALSKIAAHYEDKRGRRPCDLFFSFMSQQYSQSSSAREEFIERFKNESYVYQSLITEIPSGHSINANLPDRIQSYGNKYDPVTLFFADFERVTELNAVQDAKRYVKFGMEVRQALSDFLTDVGFAVDDAKKWIAEKRHDATVLLAEEKEQEKIANLPKAPAYNVAKVLSVNQAPPPVGVVKNTIIKQRPT